MAVLVRTGKIKYVCCFIFIWSCALVGSAQVKKSDSVVLVAKGFDVVEYFNGTPVRGNANYSMLYKQGQYHFSTQQNLDSFRLNPRKYVPAYGGSCAYGMAVAGKKYKVNPKAYEIRNGKLYLFYKTFFYDALKKWQKGNPAALVDQADAAWNQHELKQ